MRVSFIVKNPPPKAQGIKSQTSSLLVVILRLDLRIQFSYLWIARSRGCVAITLKWNIVILNEVKNLIESMPYKTEILRLKPQNDIATQPPSRAMTTNREECYALPFTNLKQFPFAQIAGVLAVSLKPNEKRKPVLLIKNLNPVAGTRGYPFPRFAIYLFNILIQRERFTAVHAV